MVSNPAQASNRSVIKTANIMLAVIQDLVSVQVIASCAVKLSCWPALTPLSCFIKGMGNSYCFAKRKSLKGGGDICYRPAVIAVMHHCGDPAITVFP